MDDSGLDWRREMFKRYASARRASHIPGFRLDVLDDLTRHLPEGSDDEAVLSFATFNADCAERRIGEELRHLRAKGWEAEWKVHDFDEPNDLKQRLEAKGLTCHHVEGLMVLETAHAPSDDRASPDAIVDEVPDSALEEVRAVQEEVWQCRLPWLGGVLREMIDPERGSAVLFGARANGRLVGTGWIDFHAGSPFAQLCGGAVLAEYRGRGIYSHLFQRRIEAARKRGTPFIAVDAAPMSRPILERKGFRYVCGTYPMRTRPFDTGAVTRS